MRLITMLGYNLDLWQELKVDWNDQHIYSLFLLQIELYMDYQIETLMELLIRYTFQWEILIIKVHWLLHHNHAEKKDEHIRFQTVFAKAYYILVILQQACANHFSHIYLELIKFYELTIEMFPSKKLNHSLLYHALLGKSPLASLRNQVVNNTQYLRNQVAVSLVNFISHL
jgi:hypothetical protein